MLSAIVARWLRCSEKVAQREGGTTMTV